MAGSDKLIKELIIQVKQKGLTTVVNNLEKLEAGLENSASGAELLDESLRPIPESLKKIISEAEELENVMGMLGRDKGSEKLEHQFENLDDTMNELVGSILQLQDSITNGFNKSSASATSDIKDLLVALERLDDTTEGVARRTQILDGIYDKLGASSTRAATGLSAIGRQGRGQTRDFAALAKIAGPIPMVYATIAANVFALSEAFRILADAAQLNRLEKIGSVMGASIGVPIQSIARDLQEATGYAVSYEDALRQASSASTFGFTAKQITDMTIAARRASVALGVDMNDALNRIIRGVSKLEIELLDELGITVRLTEAYGKYAQSIGVSVNSLTSYQKQQAYLNAVLAESEKRQAAVDPYLQANGWEVMGAAVKSATLELTKFIAEGLDPAARKMSEFLGLFSKSDAEKDIKDFSSVLGNTLKDTGSKGIANAYIALQSTQEKGIDNMGKALESKVRLQQVKAFDGMISGYAKVNPAVAGLLDSLFKDAYSGSAIVTDKVNEANQTWKAYESTVKQVRERVGNLTDAQILAAAESVKNARATKSVGETFSTVAAVAKGTQQSYEQLASGIDSVTQAQELLKRNAPGTDYFEQAGLSPEQLSKSVDLMSTMRTEFAANAALSTVQLRNQEEGIRLGLFSGEVALKNLKAEQAILQIERQKLVAAEANNSALLVNQEAMNVARLKELALTRQIKQEQLALNEASLKLLQSQEVYTDGYNSLLTSYEAEKIANKDTVDSLNLRRTALGDSVNKTAEMLDLELQINEAKRKGTDLDVSEALRKRSEATELMQRNAAGAGGAGEIASMDAAVNAQLVLAKKLYDERNISITKYEELVKQATDTAYTANQLRIQQEAELNSLFLARTGQQSTLAMTSEQELAYQQQIGAQLYENARSALDSFDPAMGAMFDGLQSFTTALIQVGETSQGVWNGVASGIQAAAGVMSFMSQKAIGDIDKQIAAEKKRDGQSEASKKKIAQLEAKKAKETEKQQRTAIIANTAVGIMSALATSGNIYAGIALAAVVAGMGAMQLAALDSGSIADPAGANSVGKLELGSRENNIDVGQAATGGELSYIRGSKGTGGIQDFVPRARGSMTSPNVSYATGEHGSEVVSSDISKRITTAEEVSNVTKTNNTPFNLTINAFDSQSIMDRASDIWDAVEAEANSKGFTLTRI